MNIQLRGIHKHFGKVHANNDIHLKFEEGQIVGILGENGAGKSTLMKILSGFQSASSGDILVDGNLITYRGPLDMIAHGVGMLQQDPLDVGAFTVLENFMYGANYQTVLNRRQALQDLHKYTARFGFDLDPLRSISSLSIAQRQQLEIVRLLALGVKTLILDEPTTGISGEQKAILFNTLKYLANEEGMIVLFVSHKLEDVVELCHRVAVLREGRVIGERAMPVTTHELVQMMFGDVLKPQTRAQLDLTKAPSVITMTDVTLTDKRLEMPNINLALRAGEVIGFAGLDGSGQSLVLRGLVGLERIQDGHVHVNGRDLTNNPYKAHLQAGVTFCAAGRVEEGLVAGLSLTEHFALFAMSDPFIDWSSAQTQMNHKIEHYKIRGKSHDLIEALSGGNQQRVLMALLPQQPIALVLENPTRGLDVDSARWIWQQLLTRRDTGAGIVFSSPDLDELVAYSDRIIVFYAGKMVEVPNVRQTNVEELGRMIGGQFESYEVA